MLSRTLAILSVLMAAAASEALAVEMPLAAAESLHALANPPDFATRQRWLDEVLARDANASESGSDLKHLLEQVDVQGISLSSADPIEFHANPEPSSMLVWSAALMGLSASGYGVRRRQQPIGEPTDSDVGSRQAD